MDLWPCVIFHYKGFLNVKKKKSAKNGRSESLVSQRSESVSYLSRTTSINYLATTTPKFISFSYKIDFWDGWLTKQMWEAYLLM